MVPFLTEIDVLGPASNTAAMACCCRSTFPALGKGRQDNHKFKVIFVYKVSLKPAWVI